MTLTITARLRRAGREIRMIVQNTEDQRVPDPALLRALARAHDFRERLTKDRRVSAHDIARAESVSAAYIYATLRLAWLAPDITGAIVSGHLPLGWPEQRKLIGFAEDETTGR